MTVTRRAAFTLLELLVAIGIIALLMGLLFPALRSAWSGSRTAHVAKEITELEAALEQFKTTYGSYPPSRITLYKTQAGWDGDIRSKSIIASLWPKFDFSGDGAGGSFPFPSGQSQVSLDGAECLTFFLGGVRREDPPGSGTPGDYIGFSSNPAQPFTVLGESRVGPFFKFPLNRIKDTDVTPDGPVEFLDPLPGQSKPYIYLSGYNGQGYSAFDLDEDGDKNTANAPGAKLETFYTQSATAAWNPKSYQIISPGQDGLYGVGGEYDPKSANSVFTGAREAERDNITNFSAGALAR